MPKVSPLQGENHKIKHVIAIMSGKGGTGKSVITSLLAIALHRQGLRVAVLDGDLTGSGIVRMFGTPLELSMTDSGNIEPLVSKNGIKIMSMDIFLEHETDATIWQGTMVNSAFKQFYSEVAWGEIDYMLIDVPPGMSDVPMTILHSLPLDGVIMVSSPQVIATVGVKKCINMVYQLKGTILGVVENMAYFMAPGGEYCEIFGPSNGTELAAFAHAPLLAQLPIDTRLAAMCDAGQIEEYHSEAYASLVVNFLKVLHMQS
jgi:Mrp family chromosome partitioning ATPase